MTSSQRNPDKPSFSDRMKLAMLKPADPDAASKAKSSDIPETVEELEAAVKSANDKERMLGLVAAPVAGGIGLLIINALIAKDPPAFVNGQANKLHASISLYHELAILLVGLSLLMIVMALLRKRLYLGIILALYGLTIFNLHYWGFGVPFLLAGGWLIARAYRLQRALRLATEEGRYGSSRPNKRYTPPSSAKRTSTEKAEKQKKAG